ncbi:hypothetical protein AMS68_005287 [Peltaster fructicola]|uniref:Zn(2)-C6 fungal-type domain-containing protein n=1 Tax=Peltaster fructicola TaxID=286661 RepID=A0A6H0XZD4_9PEZI|nr:hypothetical protein AMS68_005287 [Peltaster fructicola]
MLDPILPFAAVTAEQAAAITESRAPSKETEQPSTTRVHDSKNRKRKAHKKSRRGCENCKLRRVKCDEAKPVCQKCQSFGVDCTYDAKSTGLKFAGESSFSVHKPTHVAPTSAAMVLGSMAGPRSPSQLSSSSTLGSDSTESRTSFRWLPADLEVLGKFQQRTVLTVGTQATAKLYQNEIFKLAINYPFLTHVVLTLTLMHERHLTGAITIGERATMHWLQGTALFKEALVKPEKQSQRDALWACAAMLGCIQFACIEARTTEEAWPLKPPSSEDLDWLKMSDGKKAVWKIANVTNPESVFNQMKGHPDLYRPVHFDHTDMAKLTIDFCEVFGIGPHSNSEFNPYHDAALSLARLLPIDCDNNTILEFLAFMSRVHPKLKTLIEQKDPKALVLLACWYAKIYKYQWWIYRRGLLEGTAICIYLDRYYSHAESIQNLLTFAKIAFGISFQADHTVHSVFKNLRITPVVEVSG